MLILSMSFFILLLGRVERQEVVLLTFSVCVGSSS